MFLKNGVASFNRRRPIRDRVHVDEPFAAKHLAEALTSYSEQYESDTEDTVVLCIGTDRSTGDALGPLVGMKLHSVVDERFHVYGTLDEPVHAANLAERMREIERAHPGAMILGIDACLGKSQSVGYISVKDGPLFPGAGVNKQLPSVGHFHLIGVVNVAGFMEYLVLQNTRLNLVMRMAETIAESVRLWKEQRDRLLLQRERESLGPV